MPVPRRQPSIRIQRTLPRIAGNQALATEDPAMPTRSVTLTISRLMTLHDFSNFLKVLLQAELWQSIGPPKWPVLSAAFMHDSRSVRTAAPARPAGAYRKPATA
jgi:hypothetical protein